MCRPASPRFIPRAGLLVGAVILPLFLAACEKPEAEAASTSTSAGGAPPAMPVTVIEAKAENIPRRIEAVGQAEGSKTVEVRARVNGILEQIAYQEGERLEVGAPMFQLERKPFEISLNQARAAMAQEQARVTQARRQRDRLSKLNKQKVVSRRDYDDAIAAAGTSEAALKVALAKVEEAELNLSYTTIDAPIAGVSGRSVMSQGSLVSASSVEPLTSLVAVDPIWVRFALDQSQMLQIGDPLKASVELVTADGKTVLTTGQLNYAGSSVDLRLGTIGMRAQFDNANRTILPGQFVQVQVVTQPRQAFLVPQVAVTQGADGNSVWVVGEGDKAEPRQVKTAEWIGNQWVVEKGLVAGERVVTDNLMKLRPGAALKPQQQAAAQNAS